jgi:hypothetical protein
MVAQVFYGMETIMVVVVVEVPLTLPVVVAQVV